MRERKREGWAGVALTAILCLTFLYFWFRPDRGRYDPEPVADVVRRALAEPLPQDPAGRLLLDFDLLETAILQGGLGMRDEGLETAGAIATPVVQAIAIRQLAQSHLNDDSPGMGDALEMCNRISDAGLREEARNDVLIQIAALGFTDAVLPEAKAPVLRAQLARRLAETDDRGTARRLLRELEDALPSLSGTEAAAVREHLAWTRVSLSLTDGPDQAIPAILAQPEPAQAELWRNLFGWCSAREDTADRDLRLILSKIADPALRRSLELESLQSSRPLRTAEDIFRELEAAVAAAPDGAAKVQAWLDLADARYRIEGDEASVPPLQEARAGAAALSDPVERTELFSQLASVLPNSLLMAEALEARQAAMDAVNRIGDPAVRFSHLTALARLCFNAGDLAAATELAAMARDIADPAADTAEALELVSLLSRIGNWEGAISLLERLNGSAVYDEALRECAATIAIECIGYSPSEPPPRGQPLDRIRARTSTGDPREEAAAAGEASQQPAGLPRARAWLAIAKGRILSAVRVDEAMASPGGADIPDPGDAFLNDPALDAEFREGGAPRDDLPGAALSDDEGAEERSPDDLSAGKPNDGLPPDDDLLPEPGNPQSAEDPAALPDGGSTDPEAEEL